LFDAVLAADPSAHVRSAAVVPLAAFLVTQGYYTLYPLLTRVPAALFWSVVVVAIAGAATGVIRIAAVLLHHRRDLDGRSIGWLIASIAATLLCSLVALSLATPWLI
jgi:hypothetical protein